MRSTTLRTWLLGLLLGAGTGAGLFVALRHSQRAQTEALQHSLGEVRRELAAQRQLLQASLPSLVPAGVPGLVNGGARAGAGSTGRLSPEEVEAVAARVVELLREQAPGTARAAEAPSPVEPSSAVEQAALERTSALVERILGRGQMSSEDALELRGELATLGQSPEVDELRRRLIIAINQDRLRLPEGMPRPLF